MKRLFAYAGALFLGATVFTDCTRVLPMPPATSAPQAPLAEPRWTDAEAAPPPAPISEDRLADPNARELAQVRLVASTCEANRRALADLVERRVAEMRAQVDTERDEWRRRPTCSQLNAGVADGQGLGLSGIGEGGGGRGEGIGLGSIGGFGSGHGRLGGSHSTTNNQIEGVDEADIVKSDGRYLYLAMNGALRVVDASIPRLLSVTAIARNVRKMLVNGDRAVIFTAKGESSGGCTYGYDCTFAGDGTRTDVAFVDVTDRWHPRVVRRIELSGSLIAARAIGSTVHAVVADDDDTSPAIETVPADLPHCRKDEARVLAQFEQLKKSNERRIRAERRPQFPTLRDNGSTRTLCDAQYTPLADGRAFTTLISFDMARTEPAITTTVQSRPGAVFASESALYVAVRHERLGFDTPWYGFYGSYEELSDVHKFHIGRRPDETRYIGSGVVPGRVLNQFSMDERQGYLRIATTRGRAPDPRAESSVSILGENENGDLTRVGAIEHIAPSEDIRSVRFDGDRGYIVTFKKTDPLFVLDLAEPASPKILGELKIPGFSTYMHRLDPTHLLTIGFDADDRGRFAYFGGLMLQIFDVTRPAQPELLYKERIGTRGSSSAAATDHLAFNYFAESSTLAVPVTVCDGGSGGSFGTRLSFSGLVLYRVTAEHGFQKLGGIDHGSKGADCNAWWSNADSAVKRSVFVDDLIFSIATDRMKAQRVSALGKDVAEIPLTH